MLLDPSVFPKIMEVIRVFQEDVFWTKCACARGRKVR